MTIKLTSPIQPSRGWRNTDAFGSGHFWATRDNNSRHHVGADAIAVPGDRVYSPIAGKVDKLGWAYPNDTFRYIRIVGEKEHEGFIVRILYVDPEVTEAQHVVAGERLGIAQDISRRDAEITTHIHVEVYQAIDPARVVG